MSIRQSQDLIKVSEEKTPATITAPKLLIRQSRETTKISEQKTPVSNLTFTQSPVLVDEATKHLPQGEADAHEKVKDYSDEEDLYSLTPAHKARVSQKNLLSQVDARGTAAQETDHHPSNESRISEFQAALLGHESQTKRTAPNLQAVANAVSSEARTQTPIVPAEVATTSASRGASQTPNGPPASSHTTMISPGNKPEGKLTMPTSSVVARLREKKARESGVVTKAELDHEFNGARPRAKASAAPESKTITISAAHGKVRSNQAEESDNQGELAPPAYSGARLKKKLHDGLQGGKLEEGETQKPVTKSKTKTKQPTKVTQRATVSKAPARRTGPAPHNSSADAADNHDGHDDNENNQKPIRRERRQLQKKQQSSEELYEIPLSPVKTTARTRAAAKTKRSKPQGIERQKPCPKAGPQATKRALLKCKALACDEAGAQSSTAGGERDTLDDIVKRSHKETIPPTNNANSKLEQRDDLDDNKRVQLAAGTQHEPVVLSDGEDDSSAYKPTPKRGVVASETIQAVASASKSQISNTIPVKLNDGQQNIRATPTNIHALGGKRDQQETIQHTDRKTTLIAWDRNGARNQGAPPEPISVRTARLSMPTDLAIEGNRIKVPSSMATSTRTTRAAVPKPSNVANNVGDALADFTIKPKPIELSAGHAQYAAPPLAVVESDYYCDDLPVAQHNDLGEDVAPIFHDVVALHAPSALQPTESQLAMPHPTNRQKEQPVPTVPAMQSNTPEEFRKRSLIPELETMLDAKPANLGEENNGADYPQSAVAGRKRALVEPIPEDTNRKQIKVEMAPIMTRGSKQERSRRKPFEKVVPLVLKSEVQARRMARRETRFRHGSQGSQTVDFNGSPVPLNMEVPQQSTVLDTFSQRARFVAESDDADDDIKNRPATALIDFVPPPAYSSPPIIRNRKQHPLPPGAASDALPAVISTQAQSQNLLEKERPPSLLEVPSDSPTITTQEDEKDTCDVDVFTEQIAMSKFWGRSRAALSARSVSNGEEDESGVDLSQERDEIFAHDLVEQVEDLNDCTAFVRGNGDDTELTLVDAEEAAQPTQRLVEAPKLAPASVARKKDNGSIKAGSIFEPLSDDLLSWSKVLKPHQLSLFDEIVKCGRRIVESFVEMEDGVLITLTQLHKRRMRILRDEEGHRAQRHDQLKVELKSQRRETEKTLKRRQRNMQEGLDRLREKKTRQREEAKECEAENQALEAWLHELRCSP